MKVVYDTNILISALVFPGGVPDQILNLARLGTVQLHTSPDIVTEFRRVLTEKFRYREPTASLLVERVTSISTLTYPKERLRIITRLDADNRILECAVEAQAQFLVTGDRRDILPLGKIGKTRIVTARQFLDIFTRLPG